ncbi:hypothetical protein [Micromonospora sp. RTP1Z1]|uniref:hypothetical protein n=1 Tax=Micromonospora sp. RTP1Z1 TaxID=2994043 RepID=UPI0029C946DB|nr:hypothetical protein [Micromonospora sp. RTP1Z1]
MAVHDLWYLSTPGPDGEKVKSGKYGRGKRWRVRYVDAAGQTRDKVFQRKKDAEDFDLAARVGTAAEVKLDQGERNVTFAAYVDRWRLARNIGWALETRRRIESNVRRHLVPEFGNRLVRSITQTDVLLWLAERLGAGVPQSSLRLYFELFDAIMATAVTDKAIPRQPV